MGEMAVIQFKGYRIVKCEFSLSDGFEETNAKSFMKPIEMNFKAAYEKTVETNQFAIFLDTIIRQTKDKKKGGIYLKIKLRADFEYKGELDDRLVEINGTAIVFPYLRAVITNITANFGVTPIILPVLNINKMLEDSQKTVKIKPKNLKL